jgi:hypothetical protein
VTACGCSKAAITASSSLSDSCGRAAPLSFLYKNGTAHASPSRLAGPRFRPNWPASEIDRRGFERGTRPAASGKLAANPSRTPLAVSRTRMAVAGGAPGTRAGCGCRLGRERHRPPVSQWPIVAIKRQTRPLPAWDVYCGPSSRHIDGTDQYQIVWLQRSFGCTAQYGRATINQHVRYHYICIRLTIGDTSRICC